MKKIILLVLSCLYLSCQANFKENDYKSDFNESSLLKKGKKITDIDEKIDFYKHLYIVKQLNNLKENNYKKDSYTGYEFDEETVIDFSSFSDEVIYKILALWDPNSGYHTLSKNNLGEVWDQNIHDFISLETIFNDLNKYLENDDEKFNDIFESFFISERDKCYGAINKIENNLVYASGNCGQSVHGNWDNILLIENNNVIDLGNGLSKLSEKEYEKLESLIRKKIKNYSGPSVHINEINIQTSKNGKYIISYTVSNEDYEYFNISYETIDFKSFVPNSLNIIQI